MAEKNNGILDNLNRFGMTTLSIPYNLSSDFLNSLPFLNLNTPYIDPNAKGFMQGGFISKDEMDKMREDRIVQNMGDEYKGMLTGDSGIATLTGMEGSPELPSQKNKNLLAGPDIKMKTKPKVPETKKEEAKKEDDRPKALKDYLKEIMSDGDSLIALGGAIARGEGLVGGLEDFNKARKETAALELALSDKLYERERQKKLDEYTIATQQMDIAYKQSQMTTDDMKNAEYAAASQALAEGIDIDDPNISSDKIGRYYQILNEKMDMIINKEKPMTSADLIEQFNMQALQKALGTEDTSTGASGKTYKIIDGKLVAQ
jgi:hypothetical protein